MLFGDVAHWPVSLSVLVLVSWFEPSMRGGILATCKLHKLDASFKYPHVFHLSESKKSQPNDNAFKLAVAQNIHLFGS